jgi:LPS-assembly protein
MAESRSFDFCKRYILCLTFLFGASVSAFAQMPAAKRAETCKLVANVPPNGKLEFRGTVVVDDPARLHLSGGVNLAFEGFCLFADDLELDRTRSTLTAKGNVELSEPNGNIIRAERLTLSDEFRDAFQVAVVMPGR